MFGSPRDRLAINEVRQTKWTTNRGSRIDWRCFRKMSRYFDALQLDANDRAVVDNPSTPPLTEDNGHRSHDSEKPADEEIVKLVQRLFLFSNSHAPKAVVFSSVQGHASTAICCRVGSVLAAQGTGSVCLVDGNLRAPSLHRLFGAEKVPGLADAAFTPGPIKHFAAGISGGKFWVVPAGSRRCEAQPLLGSERMRLWMRQLREQFGYVLIDAPPLSSHSDAALLGQMADGIILIVEANSTRRENARIAKETLESANVKLLGAILNNRTYPIPEALYRKL
jgi:Mrp family chromosome partitioning ATPase